MIRIGLVFLILLVVAALLSIPTYNAYVKSGGISNKATSLEIPPDLTKPSSQSAFRLSEYEKDIYEDVVSFSAESVADSVNSSYEESDFEDLKHLGSNSDFGISYSVESIGELPIDIKKFTKSIQELNDTSHIKPVTIIKIKEIPVEKIVYVESKDPVNKLTFYLLVATTLFSLLAIAIITHHKRVLTRYTLQLAKGINTSPPKTRLREFSEVIKAVYTLQDTLKDKDFIEENTAVIRHELRNPIIFIKNSAETLKHIASNKNELDLINNILLSTSRMNLLLEQLLSQSKLHRRQGNLNIEKLNVREEVEYTLTDPSINNQIKVKNIQASVNTLKIRKSGNNPTHNIDIYLNADKLLLEVCLSNIITNAIDFSYNNKKIDILIKQYSNNIAIEVIDEGKGLPPYLGDKIYKSFISTERPNGEKSSGLGLSIVKTIMDLHNGEVSIVNSTIKSGVIAKLTFPK